MHSPPWLCTHLPHIFLAYRQSLRKPGATPAVRARGPVFAVRAAVPLLLSRPAARPGPGVRALGVLAFGVLVLAGCLGDAERGNPLDPLSDNFINAGGVTGAVVRLSAPAQGVSGASVRLSPLAGGADLVTRAGGDGRFSLTGVAAGEYRMTAEADGFASADTTVTVTVGRLTEQSVRLDALPRVTAQSVRSERINRYFPDPLIFSRIVVEATVVDADGAGDLERVDFVIPSFDGGPTELFRDSLVAVPGTPNLFRRTFAEEELPVPVQALLGRNLFVEVRDQAGSVGISHDTHVVRIVEAIPQAVYPIDVNQPVRPPFTLEWDPLALPYPFTWRVDLIFVPEAGQEILVGTLANIPSTSIETTVSSNLQPGLYAWRVSAVDEFGNSARSREAGFRVASSL